MKQVQKNLKFSKGLVHGFWQNIDLFLTCVFFGKSSHQRSFFDILDRKECFLDWNSNVWIKCKKSKICKGVSPWFLSKKRPFSHMKNSKICKGVSPWFWSKNGRFFHSGFLGKSSHKRLFFDILNRKECFLDRNSEVWKKCKKSKICKGVSPWFFFKKSPVFSYAFFWEI